MESGENFSVLIIIRSITCARRIDEFEFTTELTCTSSCTSETHVVAMDTTMSGVELAVHESTLRTTACNVGNNGAISRTERRGSNKCSGTCKQQQ